MPERKIEKFKHEAIEALQDYCRSQVDLWRQVPKLSREADKLKGWTSGRYQMAYILGYWPIFATDIYGLRVELQTGEFDRIQLFEEIELGQLDSIVDALDANGVINLLKSEIGSLSATA